MDKPSKKVEKNGAKKVWTEEEKDLSETGRGELSRQFLKLLEGKVEGELREKEQVDIT